MEITRCARRKRKASQSVLMHFEVPLKAPGQPDGALYEELAPLSVSPKRAALESGCSDISCQSELLCGEWLDQMSMSGSLDCTSTPSLSTAESLASYLSVTTEGTPTPTAPPARRGAPSQQICCFNRAVCSASTWTAGGCNLLPCAAICLCFVLLVKGPAGDVQPLHVAHCT